VLAIGGKEWLLASVEAERDALPVAFVRLPEPVVERVPIVEAVEKPVVQ
jgi:hypothetical protein